MIRIVAGAALLSFAFATGAAAEDGAALFEPCRACHSLDPAAKIMPGPNLAGLIGRKVAGDPDFDYSPVLRGARDAGRVWTRELLERFLADPEAMFPAMWMSAQGIRNAEDRKALAAFIADPASR
jgi:cytochrome c